MLLYAARADYTSVYRNLTFNVAVTTQMVEVAISDDHIVEPSEVINLTLTSTDPAVILNPSTSTITIEDVDSKLLYERLLYICEHVCNLDHVHHFSDYSWIQ